MAESEKSGHLAGLGEKYVKYIRINGNRVDNKRRFLKTHKRKSKLQEMILRY